MVLSIQLEMQFSLLAWSVGYRRAASSEIPSQRSLSPIESNIFLESEPKGMLSESLHLPHDAYNTQEGFVGQQLTALAL